MDTKTTHYLKGLKLFGEEKHTEAIAEYEQALSDSPDWTDCLHALATAQSNLEKHDDAIATVNRIIELDANDAFAYTSLSIFLMRKGMIPEAEAAAAKARMISWKEELKTNPDAPPPGPPCGRDVIQ